MDRSARALVSCKPLLARASPTRSQPGQQQRTSARRPHVLAHVVDERRTRPGRERSRMLLACAAGRTPAARPRGEIRAHRPAVTAYRSSDQRRTAPVSGLTYRRSAARHCAADACHAPIGVAQRYHSQPRRAVTCQLQRLVSQPEAACCAGYGAQHLDRGRRILRRRISPLIPRRCPRPYDKSIENSVGNKVREVPPTRISSWIISNSNSGRELLRDSTRKSIEARLGIRIELLELAVGVSLHDDTSLRTAAAWTTARDGLANVSALSCAALRRYCEPARRLVLPNRTMRNCARQCRVCCSALLDGSPAPSGSANGAESRGHAAASDGEANTKAKLDEHADPRRPLLVESRHLAG